jgi:hypothetical protein
MTGNRARAACLLALLPALGCRDQQTASKAQPTVSAHESAAVDPEATAAHSDASDPAGVVHDYYAAIQARKFDVAYAQWGDSGRSSGQTREAFARGFAATTQVDVSITGTTRVEGAAGSQYATVPVAIDAVLATGEHQHFEGAYTLRRSMVDGATAEQRRWHIFSATLRSRTPSP